MSSKDKIRLDKLFNLDFYKRQERWRLRKPRYDAKSTIYEVTSPDQTIEQLPSKQNSDNDLLTSVAEDSTVHNVAERVTSGIESTAQTVSTRLQLLMQCSQDEEIKINKVNVSETTDSDLNWEALPLYSQDLSADADEEAVGNFAFLEEADQGNYFYEFSELDIATPENWTMNQSQSSRYMSNLEEEMSLDTSNSFVSFMRDVHDAPHSSFYDLDFPDSPEEITNYRLAELSPRQLSTGISRYTAALKKLWRENNLRMLDRSVRRLNKFVDFNDGEILLAASYLNDQNRFIGGDHVSSDHTLKCKSMDQTYEHD